MLKSVTTFAAAALLAVVASTSVHAALGSNGLDWNGLDWNGLDWNGVKTNGWGNGIRWNGISSGHELPTSGARLLMIELPRE